MSEQALAEKVQQLVAEMAQMREELERLRASAPTSPTPKPAGSTSRRRALRRLAAGLLVGVGTAAVAGTALPNQAQAKFVASRGAGAIVMTNSGSVTGNLPANTVYGLIATPDDTLDFTPFSVGIKAGLLGYTLQTGGLGVLGQGPAIGVQGSSSAGYGLFGISDTGSGVYGQSNGGVGVNGNSSIGFGVKGTTTSGTGVYGFSTDLNSYGIYGQSISGTGLFGTSTNGYGVKGNSNTKDGVTGYSSGGAYSFGVSGTNNGGAYTAGVRGDGRNIGVWGWCNSTDGTGVGIYGSQNGGELAGKFDGNVLVNGTLSKSGGAFKIDHPLDPGGKYLYHSFVESPDMKNIYDGVVKLDERGEAVVELPEWFEALNADYRYQLTCLESYAPVYIAKKIEAGRFKIAGGLPNQEVSWLVTGIRQDRWAKANRIPVEQTKHERERGYYLHPEVFGFDRHRSVDPQARTGSSQV